MNWNKIRKAAHTVEVLAGDAQAVKRGRVGQRVANRLIGKAVGRGARRLWR
jgi:hypothetical protein